MSQEKNISSLASLKLNEEQARVITNLDDNFAGLSEKIKKRIVDSKLKLKPWKQKKYQQIETKRIIKPQAFQRLDHEDDFKDLDTVEKLDRIKVSALINEEYFILIDGFRRFQFQSEKGIGKIECEIIGIAECRSQISAARANVMSIFTKPLTTVELSYGFFVLGDELEKEFGESYFFKHGGDRKKNIEDQASIVDYMTKLVGMKKWAVQALYKFGKELGSYALMGLQNQDQLKSLPIRTIQKLNGPLSENDVRKKIKERVKELVEMKKDNEEIINKASSLAKHHINKMLASMEPSEGHEDPEEKKDPEIFKFKAIINKTISGLRSFKDSIPNDGKITENVKSDLMKKLKEFRKQLNKLDVQLDKILG